MLPMVVNAANGHQVLWRRPAVFPNVLSIKEVLLVGASFFNYVFL
jgi:hypothetical protein